MYRPRTDPDEDLVVHREGQRNGGGFRTKIAVFQAVAFFRFLYLSISLSGFLQPNWQVSLTATTFLPAVVGSMA